MSEEKNKIEELEKQLEKESSNFMNRITEILTTMKSSTSLNDAQILSLSLKQELVDRKRQANYLVNKQESNLRAKTNSRFRYWRSENLMKMDYREIKAIVDGEVNELITIVDMFRSHIEFYNDTIATLNSIQFAIKNKIEMEKGFI